MNYNKVNNLHSKANIWWD